MNRIKSVLFLLALIMGLSIHAQIQYLPNLAYSKVIETDKDIYPTITEGIVNYAIDVRLIYGELYLTSEMPEHADHNLPTMRSGVMMPLYSQYKKNGDKLHANYFDEMYLFVSVCCDPKRTYIKMWDQLLPYKELLTYREGGDWNLGILKVIFTGDISVEMIESESTGLISLEGTIDDLEQDVSSQLMPVIGLNFNDHFYWDGFGNMGFNEFTELKTLVRKAHDEQKKLRVYNFPEQENVYDVLLTADVDFITTKVYKQVKKIIESKE